MKDRRLQSVDSEEEKKGKEGGVGVERVVGRKCVWDGGVTEDNARGVEMYTYQEWRYRKPCHQGRHVHTQ